MGSSLLYSEVITMGDYASKGVANAGLTTGIIGTALSVLNSSGYGNGLLGGLFGNNCIGRAGFGAELQYVSSLQAENAMLKSENYSDKVAKEVYQQTRIDNAALKSEMKELMDLREQIVLSKVNEVATVTKCNLDQVNCSIAALANTIGGVTKTVIPITAICPEVMTRYNSWTAPTSEAPATQPVTGTISTN